MLTPGNGRAVDDKHAWPEDAAVRTMRDEADREMIRISTWPRGMHDLAQI
jgi:hypothetical protein